MELLGYRDGRMQPATKSFDEAQTQMSGDPADRRLESLLAKALNDQWSLEHHVDWDRAVDLPRWLPRKTYISILSQLYYGELATTHACRRLLAEIDDPLARVFLHIQEADEVRHAEAYRLYLERLGDIAPIDEALETAFRGGLGWTGSHHGLTVAFGVVLEGEALRLQKTCHDCFPCPLLRRITQLVSRDEARHVAFAKIYLDGRLAMLPRDQRIEIYEWVKALWHECARATAGRSPGLGFAVRRVAKRMIGERWRLQHESLAMIGLIGDSDGGH